MSGRTSSTRIPVQSPASGQSSSGDGGDGRELLKVSDGDKSWRLDRPHPQLPSAHVESLQFEIELPRTAAEDDLISGAGKLFAQLESRLDDLNRRELALSKQWAALEQERRNFRLHASQQEQLLQLQYVKRDYAGLDLIEMEQRVSRPPAELAVDLERLEQAKRDFQTALDEERQQFRQELQDEREAHEEQLSGERIQWDEHKRRQQEQLDRMRSELMSERSQFEETIKQVQEELDQRQRDVEASSPDLSEYEGLIAALTSRLNELEDSASLIDRLTLEVHESQQVIDDLRRECTRLQRELDVQTAQVDELSKNKQVDEIANESKVHENDSMNMMEKDALVDAVVASESIDAEQAKLLERRIAFQQQHLDKQRVQLETAHQRFLVEYQQARTQLQQDREVLDLRGRQLSVRLQRLEAKEELLDRHLLSLKVGLAECQRQSQAMAELNLADEQMEIVRQMQMMTQAAGDLEDRRKRLEVMRDELTSLHEQTTQRRLELDHVHALLLEHFGEENVDQHVAEITRRAGDFLKSERGQYVAERLRWEESCEALKTQEERLSAAQKELFVQMEAFAARHREFIERCDAQREAAVDSRAELLADKLDAEETVRKLLRQIKLQD